jgi:SAM-dependent methyltransferase
MAEIKEVVDVVRECDLCGETNYVVEKIFLANEWDSVKKFYQSSKQMNPFQYLPNKFELLKCLNCGLMYVNPRIKDWVVNRFYDEYLSGKYEGYIRNYDSSFRETLFKEYFHLIKGFLEKNEEERTFLDIGCANGEFVKIFKENGYRSYGIEVAPLVAEKAKNFGEVFIGDVEFELKKLHPDSFNVIALVDSIEHFSSPRRTMELVYDKLKSSGVVFIETPNYSAGLDIMSRHFYLFSIATMEKMLNAIGFCILYNNYSSSIYNPTDQMKEERFIHVIAKKL